MRQLYFGAYIHTPEEDKIAVYDSQTGAINTFIPLESEWDRQDAAEQFSDRAIDWSTYATINSQAGDLTLGHYLNDIIAINDTAGNDVWDEQEFERILTANSKG